MNGLLVRVAVESDLPEVATLLGGGRPAPQLPAPGAGSELLLVAAATSVDPGAARLLGCLRLRDSIGLGRPRYSYHVGCAVHAAADLGLFHRQRTLLLGNDHTGASELADLACAVDGLPLALQSGSLRLLVHSALLLVASRRGQYAAQIVAELPGRRDSAGQSPFWDGLGRHFYSGDPAQAAERFGADWRSHVASLLPRQLVYASFLTPAAQSAIAQVSDAARLQRDVLEEAGLIYDHHVGIDDGGPVLEAAIDALGPVQAARRLRVQGAASGHGVAARLPYLVLRDAASTAPLAARLLGSAVDGALRLDDAQMAMLGLASGDTVWAYALRG